MSPHPVSSRLPQAPEPPENQERSERLAHLEPPVSVRRLPVGPRQTLLLHRRASAVTIVLVLLTLMVMVLTILTGTYNISEADALGTLLHGTGSDLDRFIVIGQRLPRALAAVLVGAMLALSGAIFRACRATPWAAPTSSVSPPAPRREACWRSCWPPPPRRSRSVRARSSAVSPRRRS